MASIETVTTKKGERRYVVHYRTDTGRKAELWHDRKIDADRTKAAVETDVRRGEYLDPRASSTRFFEVADRWLATRSDKAPATRERDASYIRSLILPYFGERRLRSIRPSDVEIWITSLEKAPATRARALQLVRRILGFAVRDGLLKTNPAAEIRAPETSSEPRARALDDSELVSIFDAAETVDPSTAAMVMIMGRAGLRFSEAAALRVGDLLLEEGRLRVERSLCRVTQQVRPLKGRFESDPGRSIPMPEDLIHRLQLHLEQQDLREDADALVFTAPMGGPISYRNWTGRIWNKITEISGIDVGTHSLRHTSITRQFRVDRWTPTEVQIYHGHRDPRVTLRVYTHVNTSELVPPSALGSNDGVGLA